MELPTVTLPDDETIKKQYKIYLTEFKNYTNINYPKYKDELNDYFIGADINLYINEKFTYIDQAANLNGIIINIYHEFSEDKKRLPSSMANWFFKKLLDNPEYFARREVESWISHFIDEEKRVEYYEKEYGEYIDEIRKLRLDWIDKYFNESNKIYDKTKQQFQNEMVEVINITQSLLSLHVALILSPYQTLQEVVYQNIRDIESSLFLATHGKYIPAMSLLRRWFESFLNALYVDKKLCCDKQSRKYQQWMDIQAKWLNGSQVLPPFTGNWGVIQDLVDPDTEYILDTVNPKNQHFYDYLKSMYKELSHYVHYGKKDDWLTISFSEFNETHFKDWIAQVNDIYTICNMLLIYHFPNMLEKYNHEVEKLDLNEYEPLLKEEILDKLKPFLSSST